MYPFPLKLPVVPGSDGAGVVVEVGSKVSKWKKGDRVVTLFNQGHQFDPIDLSATKTGLGGVIDGTLREYGVFNENGLVRAPSNLNFLEASTLTCAALTSWNALYGLKQVKPGDTVLIQGTGGVSVFGLQVSRSFPRLSFFFLTLVYSSPKPPAPPSSLPHRRTINSNSSRSWAPTT